ncbi:retention module-containing protein [Campylobacter concisus]|uniref:retention module-containing protein n=1 Tax=Campylobacter concisus TaxID=199 RepID=UPI00112F852F|nr:retention module-containing protein [Campylobacter concisus]
MAREAGVVKSLTGKAVAVDQNGNVRELKVGDIVYIGESIKTSDAADKVTIVANNGKEITILGDDTLALNQNTIGNDGLADVSALQNAILNGGDLTKLEETAAGGNAAAAGGGDGVSLSDARFAEGGHYSNINENYRNLTDANRAFASYDSPIGGYSNGNSGDDTIIPGAPTVKFENDENSNHTLSRVEHAKDNDLNTSKVHITVPNDGTVRAGDVLNITITNPDGSQTKTDVVITPAIISGGVRLDAPVEPGKNSKVEATITNFQGHVSGSSEDHVTPTKSSVSVEFTEDKSPDDGFLTYTENKGDGKQNESPVLIKVSDVIPGDKLHITLTKPDGTTEPREVTIDQNIINNGYKIDNMPVAEGKISKVDAYVTDSTNSNTWKSDMATDKVTPDKNPTIRFTEDVDDNGFLTDAENKGTDGNFRTSPVEITLPKDVVAGDKIVITYTDTDPLNPTGLKSDTINLTNEMITNHKVTGIELPIFPGVKTEASVHVVDKDGNQKSEESAPDSVTPQIIKMDMSLPEQKTLHEISRQESVSSYFSNYEKPFDGVKINPGDQRVNHTTAKITLPNRIVDGDILTLHVTKPDGTTPPDRNFKINMNKKGVITSVDEIDNAGHVIGKYDTAHKNFFKEDINQWAIKVDGFELENGKDTEIKAEFKYPTHPINPNLPTEVDSESASKSASLEHVKKPEVIFDEAHGAKTMTREQAISDKKINNDLNNDLNSTMVTIKLPKNAVSGDKLTVTINEPNETPREIKYNIGKDDNGNLFVVKEGSTQKIETDGRSFKIYGIKTATGEETKVTAEIVDNDGSIQHAESSNSVTIAGLNDMAVRFVEDGDGNVSLTRAESKDGDNKLDETTIAVKVPNNVIKGDIVNVTIDGASPKTYKVTGRDDHGKITLEDTSTHTPITVNDKNEFKIEGVHIEAGKPINVSAETTDASGGKKAEAQNHNTLEKLHDDMKITFDADDGDGILGNAEATGTTTMTTIKLPSNFVDGDKLIISSKTGDTSFPEESYTIHKDKDSNGVVTVTVTKADGTSLDVVNGNAVKYPLPLANLQNGDETVITAKVTGAAGDKSETKSNIILDTGNGSGTRFRLLIDEDEDRNGWLDREEAIKKDGLNTTQATLEIPNTVNNGDIITVKATGKNTETYTVVKDSSGNISLKNDATNNIVSLDQGNKLKISDVHIDKDHPAKVEATINGVTKTAEAKLETFDATNLKVNFIEDDASRDGKIDRDEAVSVDGVKVTTISVQVPYNVINDDKITVTINQPGDSTPRTEIFKVVKDASGNISLKHNGAPYPFTNNTFEIHDVKMLPGQETTATAKITNAAGDMSETSPEAKAKLAPLSEAGLSVSIAADKNGDGVISRDESGSNTSKVKVSIPGNVIEGDKIHVTVTKPGEPTNNAVDKKYEVESKDVNGNITLKDVTDPNHPFTIVDENNNPKKFNASNPLEFDAAIAVGKDKDTEAKVTLTDAFGNSVSTAKIENGNEINVKAHHAEIDAMRGIMFNKDIKTSEESGEKTTTAKFFLSEDARAGDTVEIKYTDPNDHSQMKPVNHVLTADDISKGAFEQSLDIDARSSAGYDLKVEATLKTPGPGGLQSKTYETDQSFHINANSYTIKYDNDPHKTMKGGDSDNDTLVVDGQTIDFSRVSDAKVESFENIQLKGNSEITIKAQDVLDITDSDKVLNIKGSIDNQGNKTTSVKLDGNWEENTPAGVTGYKTYSSEDVSGHTIQIKIDDTVHIL